MKPQNAEIWTKRTPETLNAWLKENADGIRMKKLHDGFYQVYSRFCKDPELRIIHTGDMQSSRVAIMAHYRRCKSRMS